MTSGIYKIENMINEKVYIGQSIDTVKRMKTHLTELKNNVHCNTDLQTDFQKYGETNFVFQVIHPCEEEFLNPMEKYFIDKYDSLINGYNIRKENGKVKPKFKKYHVTKELLIKEFNDLKSIDIECTKEQLNNIKTIIELDFLIENKSENTHTSEFDAFLNNLSDTIGYSDIVISLEEELINLSVTKFNKYFDVLIVDKESSFLIIHDKKYILYLYHAIEPKGHVKWIEKEVEINFIIKE